MKEYIALGSVPNSSRSLKGAGLLGDLYEIANKSLELLEGNLKRKRTTADDFKRIPDDVKTIGEALKALAEGIEAYKKATKTPQKFTAPPVPDT